MTLAISLPHRCRSSRVSPAVQRAMGEFGAISVISGNIIGRTQTLTLYVEGAYKVTGSL